jgi:hypothetical protein
MQFDDDVGAFEDNYRARYIDEQTGTQNRAENRAQIDGRVFNNNIINNAEPDTNSQFSFNSP